MLLLLFLFLFLGFLVLKLRRFSRSAVRLFGGLIGLPRLSVSSHYTADRASACLANTHKPMDAPANKTNRTGGGASAGIQKIRKKGKDE